MWLVCELLEGQAVTAFQGQRILHPYWINSLFKSQCLKSSRQSVGEEIIEGGSKVKYNITTSRALKAYWEDESFRFRKKKGTKVPLDDASSIDYDALLGALHVEGSTQHIGAPVTESEENVFTHPVVQLIHERKRTGSKPGKRSDPHKVALSIEGGGMRGAVSAGMICAFHYLNLTDSLDAVYGSSAGTVVGSYLITGQLPWYGPEVYYDCLTVAGSAFIDTRRLLRALGFGLLDPRLLRDVLTRRLNGKPVLNLPYLLQTTLQYKKPLDWDIFASQQGKIPLKVIVSGLESERSFVLDMSKGSFDNLDELSNCMHASCLLPGIAGPVMNMNTKLIRGEALDPGEKKLALESSLSPQERREKNGKWEPLADALLYEPLPFRSAIKEGATHVVVVRSRPDGVDVTGRGSLFERFIFRRFFRRKNKLPRLYQYMKQQRHKQLYAEDIIRLNHASRDNRNYNDVSQPHLATIAVQPDSREIGRLETRREVLFDALRRGFARAYDCLVDDYSERGNGAAIAKVYFPDEILDYDPIEMEAVEACKPSESAFEKYMRLCNVHPKSWTTPSGWMKSATYETEKTIDPVSII
jgi:predicted patatin/cPLA2 family phospholipase